MIRNEQPDHSTIGKVGAFYLLNESTWIARHVEAIEIESDTSGRRRLTVDVELPRDPRTVLDTHGGEALFCLPFALLAKHPPTSHIDVRDEAGNALPLLTRAENGWISSDAVRAAMLENRGHLYEGFEEDLDDLVFVDPEWIEPAVAAGVMLEAIDDAGPGADRLGRVVQDLAVCSMLWVSLWGVPGERRVVKLSYAITFERPPLVLHNDEEVSVTVQYPEEDGRPNASFSMIDDQGSIRWRDTCARLLSPVWTALGWKSLDVQVSFPDLRGAHTYHMQVVAPEGLTLAGIEAEGDGPQEPGRHCDGMRAHLYLPDTDAVGSGPIRFTLKVERRGFLNLSLMATVLTAGGLWLAQAHAHKAQDQSVNQISAAVLLVLPALLAVFVIRQTEHPIVTRMLAGVRALVLIAGLASIGAAAALSRIRFGMWQTVSEAWIWCAALASLAALGVALAWLRSFDGMQSFKPRDAALGPTAYLARVGLVGAALLALCVAVRSNLLGLGDAEPLAIGLLLLSAATAGVCGVSPTTRPERFLRVLCLVDLVAALALACVTALTHSDVRDDVALGAAAVAGLSLLLALASRLPTKPAAGG